MEFTREELIEICERAVVHVSDWRNRDSASAQLNVQDIYGGLKAGIGYDYSIDDDTIDIYFDKPTKKQGEEANSYGLGIYYADDYIERYGGEMFHPDSHNWESGRGYSGYLPTPERLYNSDGDWY